MRLGKEMKFVLLIFKVLFCLAYGFVEFEDRRDAEVSVGCTNNTTQCNGV